MKNETDDLECYYYRADGDGHDYFVPCEIIKEFDAWIDLDPESDEFYDHPGYDHLSLGKSFYDIKMWIHPDNLK
jgi:hypothetical protein